MNYNLELILFLIGIVLLVFGIYKVFQTKDLLRQLEEEIQRKKEKK